MLISEIFEMTPAKSKSTDDYTKGPVAFVTNTEMNNGVVSYVEPFDGDKVFEGPAICISGLGHATVHLSPFLPKGNGGDSCTVLIPKQELTNNELLYYASLFNTLHGWRFSFGRKTSKRRLSSLELSPLHNEAPINIEEETSINNNLMLKLLKEKEDEFSA
ncbi:restriction endonuclease subunit S [Endozoicomonas sp. SESOKO4]|uniref:restriction endonuclease subunit S n=1 Tax=Endozoicomonas sp. SESOKO4 TaxID=2828745 RepID=UPI00214914ED|nr:restriction endonuclease subunit S [Endozoicomonas sp. SESOKO4]